MENISEELPLITLVGPPNSGKTTLLSALASIPKIKQGNILFLAPTGKARVRMEEKAKKHGEKYSAFTKYSGEKCLLGSQSVQGLVTHIF